MPTQSYKRTGHADFKGRTFGSLKVLFRVVGLHSGFPRWRCQCTCGKRITVRHDYLTHTYSPKRHCGCQNKKQPPSLIARNKELYHIWKMVLVRCENPAHKTYQSYGARGIKVCERWHSFEAFLEDVGPRPSKNHSLDRVDPDGDYEPFHSKTGEVQVRWATSKDQGRNKRKSLFLPHPDGSGVMIPAAEVAEILGLSYQMMRHKYKQEGKWPT